MTKTITLYKQIPSSEGTIFQLTGTPRAGVGVMLENHDGANNLAYKFQASNDGTTWEDKTFRDSAGDEVTNFVLAPESAAHIKLNMTTTHVRLRASGTLDAQVVITYSVAHDPEEATSLYV